MNCSQCGVSGSHAYTIDGEHLVDCDDCFLVMVEGHLSAVQTGTRWMIDALKSSCERPLRELKGDDAKREKVLQRRLGLTVRASELFAHGRTEEAVDVIAEALVGLQTRES